MVTQERTICLPRRRRPARPRLTMARTPVTGDRTPVTNRVLQAATALRLSHLTVAMAALLRPKDTALRLRVSTAAHLRDNMAVLPLDNTEPLLLSNTEARATEVLNTPLTVNRVAMVDLPASSLRRLGASTLVRITDTRQQLPQWKISGA